MQCPCAEWGSADPVSMCGMGKCGPSVDVRNGEVGTGEYNLVTNLVIYYEKYMIRVMCRHLGDTSKLGPHSNVHE